VSGGNQKYDTVTLRKLIIERCPSYEIVTEYLRGEMRLFILVKKKLADEVSEVRVKAENTGIGSILANKGGIVATMTIRKTRLTFMTCHLEAHEGITHYQNRNSNLYEILDGTRTGPKHTNLLDASVVSHHMFLCGDLNYRINFAPDADQLVTTKSKRKSTLDSVKSNAGKKSKESKNGSYFPVAKGLIEEEKWDELNAGDELAKALRDKDCLTGFTTLPCNFPPTFKVDRKDGYEYNKKRTPSYTDRILWKSADGMNQHVIPFLYEPCPKFITSDHKPLRGGFAVRTNTV